MPDAYLYARQGAKDMPNARHARSLLARASDPWPGHRDDGPSTEDRASLRLREPYHSETPCINDLREVIDEGMRVIEEEVSKRLTQGLASAVFQCTVGKPVKKEVMPEPGACRSA